MTPRLFAPGGEVAGYVEAVGDGVKSIKRGDRVIGSVIAGGMAERLTGQAAAASPCRTRQAVRRGALILSGATPSTL